MSILKNSSLALSLLVVLAIVETGCGAPASHSFSNLPNSSSGGQSTSSSPSGGVTVSTPANGASVGSPFNLVASASSCSSQPVTSFGYSLDDSTSPTVVSGASINTQVGAQSGTHTLHVKAWGNQGASCDTDVVVAVTDSSSPEQSLVPANAIRASNLQTSESWQASHDPVSGAGSSGSMNMVGSPSLSGHARQFNTSFSGNGGEIYDLAFGNDPSTSNFFYDAWVYLTSSASNIQNLEMDMNQVLTDGETVIYGFQCDGISGTWDYTANQGTASNPADTWVHSNAACNVRNWSQNAWHHIQISYQRDDSGNVTYNSVWLDGVEAKINATVPSAFSLGWTPTLLTNFQVDGIGSGSNTVYLDNLTISRW